MSNIIQTTDLTLSYRKDEVILENTNFNIKKGDFVFITGKSGSGKSTLLKSLYGQIKPFSGDLIVDEHDMNNIGKKELRDLRKELGIVFQDYKLINELTVGENISLPLKLSGYDRRTQAEQVKVLLNHVELKNVEDKYPLELSGGEQQRVGLARALALRPKLMLADEPTGNLDSFSSKVIWNLMEQAIIQFDTTILVVTHEIPKLKTLNHRKFNIENKGIYEVF